MDNVHQNASSSASIMNNYDFGAGFVIRPPKEADLAANTDNRRTTRLYIDSRDRNTVQDSSPNAYTVTLDEDINDVVSVELINSNIPSVPQNVGPSSSVLHVNADGSLYSLAVPFGNYDISQLATQLQTQLTSTIGTQFNVAADQQANKLTFTSGVPFTFLCASTPVPYGPQWFEKVLNPDGSKTERRNGASTVMYAPNSIARVIGFGRDTYTAQASNASYTLTSPFQVDLVSLEPIFMFIDMMSVNTSVNDRVNKSFAVLSKSDSCKCETADIMFKKTFMPPLAKLSKIRVCFKDYYGNAIDFQNRDHNFQLLVTSLRNNRNYQSFLTSHAHVLQK